MTAEMEALEQRIEALRAQVRRAAVAGDRDLARGLRAELRAAERLWDESLERLEQEAAGGGGEPGPQAGEPAGQGAPPKAGRGRSGPLLPAREQVHQALTLLGAPAAPRLIVTVHYAFYSSQLDGTRLTSLRRDEERSFRSAPFARPYYICAALTADLLSPARGLLAISTWPMDRRIVGPLSPRVDYLTAAIRIAERFRELSEPSADARRLLWRLTANIPRSASAIGTMDADDVVTAAKAELAVHQQADSEVRSQAAARARARLDDAAQLFGAGLRISRQSSPGA